MRPSASSRQTERQASVEGLVAALALTIRERRRFTTGEVDLDMPRDAPAIAKYLGLKLDPWQLRVLATEAHDILLLVTRQGGKGEVATLLALDGILNNRNYTVLIVSKAERQAKRLLKRIKNRYAQLAMTSEPTVDTATELALPNGSSVLAVPGSEETIRGIDAVDLLIVDEASVVPDDLYAAVVPMLATTDGRQVLMSTPRGKRGFFWREWAEGGDEWHREVITWREIPRFSVSWIERQRRRLGEYLFSQEFECVFVDDETQYFSSALVSAALSDEVQPLGLPMLGAA
jgi:hypothetical protein